MVTALRVMTTTLLPRPRVAVGRAVAVAVDTTADARVRNHVLLASDELSRPMKITSILVTWCFLSKTGMIVITVTRGAEAPRRTAIPGSRRTDALPTFEDRENCGPAQSAARVGRHAAKDRELTSSRERFLGPELDLDRVARRDI